MMDDSNEWRLPSDGPPLTTLRGCSMNLFTFASLLSWVGLLLAGAGCCMGLVLCRGTSPGAGATTVIVILSLGWMVIIYTVHIETYLDIVVELKRDDSKEQCCGH